MVHGCAEEVDFRHQESHCSAHQVLLVQGAFRWTPCINTGDRLVNNRSEHMSDYSEPSAVFTSTYVDNHRIMISITTTKITEAPEAISYQNEIRYRLDQFKANKVENHVFSRTRMQLWKCIGDKYQSRCAIVSLSHRESRLKTMSACCCSIGWMWPADRIHERSEQPDELGRSVMNIPSDVLVLFCKIFGPNTIWPFKRHFSIKYFMDFNFKIISPFFLRYF